MKTIGGVDDNYHHQFRTRNVNQNQKVFLLSFSLAKRINNSESSKLSNRMGLMPWLARI